MNNLCALVRTFLKPSSRHEEVKPRMKGSTICFISSWDKKRSLNRERDSEGRLIDAPDGRPSKIPPSHSINSFLVRPPSSLGGKEGRSSLEAPLEVPERNHL